MATEPKPEAGRTRAVRAGSNVAVRPAPVRLELLTDPWSVWCWGLEPVRRALELRYPTIEFRPLVGGMFPEMPDPEAMGFDVARFFAIVQRTTGMPVRTVERTDRPDSTYPSCVHVHAARILDPAREAAYLRAMREAVYLDGQNVSRPDIAGRVARRVGIDEEAFHGVLDSGAAEEAFRRRLAELHAQGLHAYPTLLLKWGDRVARVEGFQSLPAVLGLAESLSGRKHAPLPDPALEDVVPPGQRVATREVAEVFGVSPERALERLADAETEGRLVRERHPTGDVWSRA
jgi:putative protein-disulfide isomerase